MEQKDKPSIHKGMALRSVGSHSILSFSKLTEKVTFSYSQSFESVGLESLDSTAEPKPTHWWMAMLIACSLQGIVPLEVVLLGNTKFVRIRKGMLSALGTIILGARKRPTNAINSFMLSTAPLLRHLYVFFHNNLCLANVHHDNLPCHLPIGRY